MPKALEGGGGGQGRLALRPLRLKHPFGGLFIGPRRSLSLQLRDASVYEPQIQARLGTTTMTSSLTLSRS